MKPGDKVRVLDASGLEPYGVEEGMIVYLNQHLIVPGKEKDSVAVILLNDYRALAISPSRIELVEEADEAFD